jgi:GMP synthase (glutamine-hydrolysing)
VLVVDTEVDPAYDYLPRALRELLPTHELRRPRAGDPLPDSRETADLEAVVLTGSTAGVYQSDEYPWIADARAFVRRLVAARVPTLGVCFGHQLVNDALGGAVAARDPTARLVEVDFDEDPLFEGVAATVPMVHGDRVLATGEGLVPIAAADYYRFVATRHVDAPVWTVQYHPEFQADLLDRIRADFGWRESALSFDAVTTDRTVRNFLRLAGLPRGRDGTG